MTTPRSFSGAPVVVAAFLVVVFGSTSASLAAPLGSPVPKTCPSTSVVASTLKQKVSKVASTFSSSSTGSKRTCTYTTSFVVPTKITFGSPVTAAAFAASQKAASKGVPVVSVHGLGDAAWAVKAGTASPSSREHSTSADQRPPQTTDAELEALARKIL